MEPWCSAGTCGQEHWLCNKTPEPRSSDFLGRASLAGWLCREGLCALVVPPQGQGWGSAGHPGGPAPSTARPPLTVPHQPGPQASTEPAPPPDCKFYFPTNDLRCPGAPSLPIWVNLSVAWGCSPWPCLLPRLTRGSDERMRGPVLPRCGRHCPAPALPGLPAAAAPGPAPLATAAARALPSCPRAHSFRVDQSPHVQF